VLNRDTEQRFRKWIETNQTFSNPRSAGNVVSRLRRVAKHVDIDAKVPDPHLFAELETKADFEKSSPSVRSQLKKALRCYRQFQASASSKA